MNILIVGIALFVCSIFLLYRNQYVFNIRSDIREAISDYNLDQILHGIIKKTKYHTIVWKIISEHCLGYLILVIKIS